MATRLELQEVLEGLAEHVYFQPPSNVQMQYPCILYERDDTHSDFADNTLYMRMKRYQVTVVDRDPDSEIPDQVEILPYCEFNRAFVADSLHHSVYNLFF